MKLDHNTVVPVSAVIFLVGAVFWLASAHAQIVANTRGLRRIESKLTKLDSVDRRLTRIEGSLEILINFEGPIE